MIGIPKTLKKNTKLKQKGKQRKEATNDPLVPLNLDEELKGVSNVLIKFIVLLETLVLNTFIYSLSLISDLPRLLAYITPTNRFQIATISLIMAGIYNVLHLLSYRFSNAVFFIRKPMFHKYTAYTTLILALITFFVLLGSKHKYENKSYVEEEGDLSEEEYEEEENEEDVEYVDTPDTTWNSGAEEKDWGISDLPVEEESEDKINLKTKKATSRPSGRKSKEKTGKYTATITETTKEPIEKESYKASSFDISQETRTGTSMIDMLAKTTPFSPYMDFIDNEFDVDETNDDDDDIALILGNESEDSIPTSTIPIIKTYDEIGSVLDSWHEV